ncbi:hypothetical protein MCOR25_010781 [Pyricularia grisea]|uniref:Uncharacterized protein n=1 Tax=Pyricularia grisea TaxID=148305 RepID=A0A6P8B3T6_PYRGI|nr:hypothetical protein PgNI_06658 [Pyricularia grisea]KAI6348594.1 hypothetical protein MCOR25_010781 [Pyricularia grisea]TLD09915.1 hypothetical protein PgNI_06658 [Pyricularia grisea]
MPSDDDEISADVPELYKGYHEFRVYVASVRSRLANECMYISHKYDLVVQAFSDHELHEHLNACINSTPIDLHEYEISVFMWQWTTEYIIKLFINAGVVPEGSSWPHNIWGTPYAILEEVHIVIKELLRKSCDQNFTLYRERYGY